jgi:hypothetical protein
MTQDQILAEIAEYFRTHSMADAPTLRATITALEQRHAALVAAARAVCNQWHHADQDALTNAISELEELMR